MSTKVGAAIEAVFELSPMRRDSPRRAHDTLLIPGDLDRRPGTECLTRDESHSTTMDLIRLELPIRSADDWNGIS